METGDRGFGATIHQLPGSSSTGQSPVLQKIKESVASGLNKAADALHSQADKAQQREFADYGHRTAGWLERSADYVGNFEPQQLRTDIESQVRQNPAKSLLIAGAAGLVLGALFRRRR